MSDEQTLTKAEWEAYLAAHDRAPTDDPIPFHRSTALMGDTVLRERGLGLVDPPRGPS